MSLVILFFACFIFSFLGTLPFGMINMAVADVAIRKGMGPAIMFSLGAAIIEFGQGMITVKFLNLFMENEQVLSIIEWLAVIIFFACGIYFFFKKERPVQIEHRKYKYDKGWIFKGMGISALNFMPYPFWIFFSTFLISNGIMERTMQDYIILSLGMMLGAFAMFILYARGSVWLIKKNAKLEASIRKVFASLFMLLGILQMLRIIYMKS